MFCGLYCAEIESVTLDALAVFYFLSYYQENLIIRLQLVKKHSYFKIPCYFSYVPCVLMSTYLGILY